MTISKERIPPTKFYESTLDWIKRSHNRKRLKKIYPQIPIPMISHPNEMHLLVNKPQSSNKAFVALLPNGRVLEDRAVISPDNRLLWDVSVEWGRNAHEHTIFQETKLPPLIKTNKTVALLNHPAAYNYYHWMLETIARIHLIQKCKIKIDRYIINHQSFQYQLFTLAACGIPFRKIVQPHHRFHLQARKLIVPSYVNLPNEWSCNYVRNLLLPRMAAYNETGSEYIYIRRKTYRRIINEVEVFGILERYGFKSVELELMPIEQQIRLFHSAKVIVAPHGAGLANLVFCNPYTKVIEIFNPSFMEPHYWLISKLLGLNYHMIIGKSENPHHYWSGFDDISIDVNQLLEVL